MARLTKYPEEFRYHELAQAHTAEQPLRPRGPDWGDDLEDEAAESPREGLPSGEAWTAGQPCSALLSLSQITLLPLGRSAGPVRLPRTWWGCWSRFSR
jgi:hypothetical protein